MCLLLSKQHKWINFPLPECEAWKKVTLLFLNYGWFGDCGLSIRLNLSLNLACPPKYHLCFSRWSSIKFYTFFIFQVLDFIRPLHTMSPNVTSVWRMETLSWQEVMLRDSAIPQQPTGLDSGHSTGAASGQVPTPFPHITVFCTLILSDVLER